MRDFNNSGTSASETLMPERPLDVPGSSCDERLAVYGSLRPGGSNAHVLDRLAGTWIEGTVRGRLVEKGWAAAGGYPAMLLDAAGPEQPVVVFCSSELPSFWPDLDAFEGTDYRRVKVQVRSVAGLFDAFIYELAPA
jgi:gamma-glutamylcyclotransferase (GGCT)/AIG2-like uncharacterized protein YtfP